MSRLTPAEIFDALHTDIRAITAHVTSPTRGNLSITYLDTLIIVHNQDDIRYLRVRGSSLSEVAQCTRSYLQARPDKARVLAREVTNCLNGHHVFLRNIINTEDRSSEGTLSRLTISVDELNDHARRRHAFDLAQETMLMELTLLPPSLSSHRLYEIRNTTNFLVSFSSLTIVLARFNTVRDVEVVLKALQAHRGLTHLAILVGDRSPIWTVGHEDRKYLSNALCTGLNGLSGHLRYLVIDPWLYNTTIHVRKTISSMKNLKAPPNCDLALSANCETDIRAYFRSTL